MVLANDLPTNRRGAFLLLEGVDRCGKTTQSGLLLNRLLAAGVAATAMRFPDRTTATGQLINNYLASGTNLDDRAVHLLFSSNRWEATTQLTKLLEEGTTVVCDRYAYSGVAFSAAKIVDETNAQSAPLLDIEWCKAPDMGLPSPDCVLFLDLSQEEAEKRGGYGGERYEKREMQLRVRERFMELRASDEGKVEWKLIDAAQTVEKVEDDIWQAASEAIEEVEKGKALGKMWQEGSYES